MPAIAAKATRATTRRYSTNPWPLSSLWKVLSRLKTVIDFVLSPFGVFPEPHTSRSPRGGNSTQGTNTRQRRKWRQKNTSKFAKIVWEYFLGGQNSVKTLIF